jgi:hypothetical protein
MKHGFARRFLRLAQAGTFVLISGVSFADDPTGFTLVDGISVYYAVLPAEIIRGYPKGSPEFDMHGGPPAGKHIHHVMVALFDSTTLERITDAEVKAGVAEIGLAATVRKLEPMSIASALTYGNFFHFYSLATYKVTVEILRAGSTKAIQTSFEYKHH